VYTGVNTKSEGNDGRYVGSATEVGGRTERALTIAGRMGKGCDMCISRSNEEYHLQGQYRSKQWRIKY
jgi:hypothetical protein